MSEKEKGISIGAQELKDLLTAVVQEAKKPAPPTEAELKRQEEEQEQRQLAGEQQRDMIAQKKANQSVCSHTRPSALGGGTRTIFIQDDLGGYMLCQKCHIRVRPALSEDVRKRDAVDIVYDTRLFNELFQAAQPSIFA